MKATVVVSPSQTNWSAGSSTCAVGLTVIVKSSLGPVHGRPALSKNGVTVIIATTGALVSLKATKDGILPLPLAARPIDVSSFVHVYVVIPTVFCVVKTNSLVVSELQNTRSAGSSTCAVGLTVIVNV